MSIFTVTIGATTYEVYGGMTSATQYIGGIFGPAAAAWLGLDDVAQAQSLITATRYLDQQPWEGVRTGLVGGTPTTLAWPRSGVILGDGTVVDSATVPIEFPEAIAELAVLIAGDPKLPGKADQGSNIQAANAGGGTGVTFFAPTSARTGTAPVRPVAVQRLIGKYLATVAASTEGGFGQAGRGCSEFSRHSQFTLIRGEE